MVLFQYLLDFAYRNGMRATNPTISLERAIGQGRSVLITRCSGARGFMMRIKSRILVGRGEGAMAFRAKRAQVYGYDEGI